MIQGMEQNRCILPLQHALELVVRAYRRGSWPFQSQGQVLLEQEKLAGYRRFAGPE